MKRVLTYGTFDMIHDGHVNLLRRAKQLGDYLVVAVSTDEFNVIKDKKSYCSYEKRKLIVESKLDDVKNYNIDIVVMGSDWEGSNKFEYLKEHAQLVYLPRTEGISTTKIKYDLKEIYRIAK